MYRLFRRAAACSVVIVAIGSGCGRVEHSEADAGQPGPSDATLDAAEVDAMPGPAAVTLTAAADTKKLGAGSDPEVDACPAGQALKGITGATAAYSPNPVVGVIRGTCGALTVDVTAAPQYSVATQPGALLTSRGTGNDTPWELPCPSANQLMVGVEVHVGGSLDQIALRCAPITLVRSDVGWSGELGAVAITSPEGGPGGSPDTARCAAGQVVTGYQTEISGNTIAAIELKCSTVSAQ